MIRTDTYLARGNRHKKNKDGKDDENHLGVRKVSASFVDQVISVCQAEKLSVVWTRIPAWADLDSFGNEQLRSTGTE